jgi:hypothetical protein
MRHIAQGDVMTPDSYIRLLPNEKDAHMRRALMVEIGPEQYVSLPCAVASGLIGRLVADTLMPDLEPVTRA